MTWFLIFFVGFQFRRLVSRKYESLLNRRKAELDEMSALIDHRVELADTRAAQQDENFDAMREGYSVLADRRDELAAEQLRLAAAENAYSIKTDELLQAITQHNEVVAQFKARQLRMFTRPQKTYTQ